MSWIKVIFLAFFFGIFGGIFATQILWPYFVEKPLFLKYKIEIPQGYKIERKEIRIQEKYSFERGNRKSSKEFFFCKNSI